MKPFPTSRNSVCKYYLDKSVDHLHSLVQELKIENVEDNFFKDIVIPLSVYLDVLPKKEKPYFICISGGQGSGKTTLSEFIQVVLTKVRNRTTVGFSIDDLYKTQKERERLSKTVHPLCRIRGVPGTHDIQMGLDAIHSLSNANDSTLTPIPSFSKPLDKHNPRRKWKRYKGRPEYIFFDAWCGGAKPIEEKNWKGPINALEKKEDPKGVWSKWSNKELAGDYQDLFALFDLLILIKVPSIEFVYESRWLQEQTLYKTIKDKELRKRIMTKKEVYKFVMHYERLTHYILEEMPNLSDIVLARDEKFNFHFVKTPKIMRKGIS